MDDTRKSDEAQTARWNGASGHAWVDAQPVLDGMFQPFDDLIVESLRPARAGHVLDVGCGTGSTTLAVARRLGPQGRYVGIDISDPMVTAARARAEREGTDVSFIRADARQHAFEPAAFDTIISRFGVMFFDDAVQAFANLRRAAAGDAELRFIAWRSATENPFMTTAERAAAPLLPNLPTRRPHGPGQFAFAEPGTVHHILEASGWAGIDIQPIDVACMLPVADLVRHFTLLGPLGLTLPEANDATRTLVIETVRAAFDTYVRGTEVHFTAACWMVSAQAFSSTQGDPGR
jgi:SAM-dependent methyltransferase